MIIKDNAWLDTGQADFPVEHLSCTKNDRKFSNGLPNSIIIHYTAGRSAESSAKYLAKPDVKASAHVVIGRDGKIYQLVPFDTISWHAGVSAYREMTGLNKYSVGIEVENAGELKKVGPHYESWFGEKYPPEEVVTAKHRNHSYVGYWHNYTRKQLEAVETLCELIKEKYNIKYILGHEEIAPDRKKDPGPAFPLDQLRNRLIYNNRDMDEPGFDPYEGAISAELLNIRQQPGTEGKLVAQPLPLGQKVKVVDERNGWVKVETSITGWVSKAYVKPEE